MKPSGRWAQAVNPKGTLSHTSQNWAEGMTLMFTRMLASFHCSTRACTVCSSHAGSLRHAISVSKPSG